MIQWHWSDRTSEKRLAHKAINVSTMDQIISFMVPLGLTSTNVANIIDDMVHFAYVNAKEEDAVILFEPPPREFEATFKISMTEFSRKRAHQDRLYMDIDMHPVSDGPMLQIDRAIANSLDGPLACPPEQVGLAGEMFFHDPKRLLPALDEKTKKKIEVWVISKDSIIIQCRRYVLLIGFISLVIVLGGTRVPFLVKQKISVDALQITTFAWMLAGFITVFGKSLYVADWPWHDFIRGRVVCHIVNDTHDVTGAHCQTIIWNLLHAELDTILRTKGPHNGMFSRKRDGGATGFAIDQPVHLLTMLASRFVVLKVLNGKGEHLICMDLQKETIRETHSRMEKEKFLASMNVNKRERGYAEDGDSENGPAKQVKEGKSRQVPSDDKVLKLAIKEFRGDKVLGLYEKDSRFV